MVNLDKVREAAKEICEREACLLWDISFVGAGRGRTLRVSIEAQDGDVSLEHCENVSKALNLILDVQDLVPGGAYQLEVSSPGVERDLKEAWHFDFMRGRPVEVLLNEKIKVEKGDPLRVRGVVGRVESGRVFIERSEGDEVNFDLALVKRAKSLFDDGSLKKRS